MKYSKEIAAFKLAIQEQYKVNDCSKPVKGSKTLQIIVDEHENGAAVALYYDEKFIRMFGKHNGVEQVVFQGDLKAACQVARELKSETSLPIKFWKYEEILL